MPHLYGQISVPHLVFTLNLTIALLPFHHRVMGKSSEDQLSSDGELQGQPVEATAAKISMGKLFLLIGTIVTPRLSYLLIRFPV